MDFDSFHRVTQNETMPTDLGLYLSAMWHDARGDWHAAHECVQSCATSDRQSSRIHAYLHRKEGDLRNARIWYDYAGHAMPSDTLDAEWETIVRDLLAARKS